MFRHLIPLSLVAIIGIFLYIGLDRNPHDIGVTAVGKSIPAFALTQVLDTQKTLTEGDLLGKVSLLNVWASWCITCRHEHPLLMQLATETDISLYGLNYLDDPVKAKTLLQKIGNPYIASGLDAQGQVGIALGLTGTPETFIIDKKGIIRHKVIGSLTKVELEQKIFPLIERLQNE